MLCWGSNFYGELGDGTDGDHNSPVEVSSLREQVVAIDAADSHTCVLTLGGTVKCWGLNSSGQLGDGTTGFARRFPVDVIGLVDPVIAIAAGSGHTCALTVAGGVKCWGANMWGQLGDGTMSGRLVPVDVVGLTSGVSAIAATSGSTCALTDAGGVKCWGLNQSPDGGGYLGDGSRTNRLVPVDVVGLTSGVSSIAAGSGHTCAITDSGSVKCWGGNQWGELGDGTTAVRLTPVDVVGLVNPLKAIVPGSGHTCALAVAGNVKCWGGNGEGQLGDGTTIERHTPVDVSDFTIVVGD